MSAPPESSIWADDPATAPATAPAAAPPPVSWRQRLGVLLLGALIFLPGIASRDLWNPDEPRYTVVAREMVESGNYLVPHLNGDVYKEKPPLQFWAIAAAGGLLGGIGPAAARLPAVLAACLTMLLLFELGGLLFSRRAGWLAAVIFATAVRVLWQGRVGQIDGLLVGLVALAMYLWARGFFEGRRGLYPWFFVVTGLATVAKGPVGLLPPLLSIVAFLLISKHRSQLRELRVGRGLLLWAVVVLAWFVPAVLAGGGEYLQAMLLKQNVTRFVEPWHHHRPWFYYLTVIPHDFFPWSFLLPSALVVGWRRFTGRERLAFLWALCWFVVTVVFFSLSPGKRTVYILTMYPALALLVAAATDRLAEHWPRDRRWWTVPMVLLAALLTALAAAFPFVARNRPELDLFAPWLPTAVACLLGFLAAGAIVALIVSFKGRPALAAGVLAGTFGFAAVGAVVGLLPLFDVVKSARPLSEKMLASMAPGDTYAIYPRIDPTFIFYTHKRAVILNTEEQLFEYAARRDGVWLFADREALAKLSRPLPMEEVARDNEGEEGYTLFHQATVSPTPIPSPPPPELAISEPEADAP